MAGFIFDLGPVRTALTEIAGCRRKPRADKKAEILDRMRRKQQEEEEQREKDEVEAQKRREGARAASRPVPSLDATRLHQTSRRPRHFAPRRSRPRNRRPPASRRWV